MGARGPLPKSRETRQLEGNPSHRPLPGAAPPLRAAVPPAPDCLTREACEEWTRVTAELLEHERICGLDMAVLALYCETWADWVRGRREMLELQEEGGFVVTTENGQVYDHPVIRRVAAAAKLCSQFCGLLGLSPMARLRMPPPPELAAERAARGKDSLAAFAARRPLPE